MEPVFQPLELHEDRRGNGIGVAFSLAVHFGLLSLAWLKYTEAPKVPEPPLRYVQLVGAQPRNFVEAPGPALERAAPNAPFSDANRRASTPQPTGDQPTSRPGLTDAPFVPGAAGPLQPRQAAAAEQPAPGTAEGDASSTSQPDFAYRVGDTSEASVVPRGSVDWRSAIKEVGKVASLGGEMGVAGGETGFAESGPISFETQWYEWGDYARLMVARIRHHWYENMPGIVRLGLKGVVTLRFTIQRDGKITDLTILSSSGVPPFDFAARRAIELSSPLAPLPADFPNPSERVTAAFYYNERPPR